MHFKGPEKAFGKSSLFCLTQQFPNYQSCLQNPFSFLLAEYVLTSKPTLLAERPQGWPKTHTVAPLRLVSHAVGTQPLGPPHPPARKSLSSTLFSTLSRPPHPLSRHIPGPPESSGEQKEAFLRQKARDHGSQMLGAVMGHSRSGRGAQKMPPLSPLLCQTPCTSPPPPCTHSSGAGSAPQDTPPPPPPPVVGGPAAGSPGPPVRPTGPRHQLPRAPSPSPLTQVLPLARARPRSQLPAWPPPRPPQQVSPQLLALLFLQPWGWGPNHLPGGKAGGRRDLAQPLPIRCRTPTSFCSQFQPGQGQAAPAF